MPLESSLECQCLLCDTCPNTAALAGYLCMFLREACRGPDLYLVISKMTSPNSHWAFAPTKLLLLSSQTKEESLFLQKPFFIVASHWTSCPLCGRAGEERMPLGLFTLSENRQRQEGLIISYSGLLYLCFFSWYFPTVGERSRVCDCWLTHKLDLAWRPLPILRIYILPTIPTPFQGQSLETVRGYWEYLDSIYDWTQLRPLYKLLRSWQVGEEISSFSCPKQTF